MVQCFWMGIYLNGHSEVIPILYFGDEVLNPAGHLQENGDSVKIRRKNLEVVFILTATGIHSH